MDHIQLVTVKNVEGAHGMNSTRDMYIIVLLYYLWQYCITSAQNIPHPAHRCASPPPWGVLQSLSARHRHPHPPPEPARGGDKICDWESLHQITRGCQRLTRGPASFPCFTIKWSRDWEYLGVFINRFSEFMSHTYSRCQSVPMQQLAEAGNT